MYMLNSKLSELPKYRGYNATSYSSLNSGALLYGSTSILACSCWMN